MNKTNQLNTINTDILVIGGGLSGLWAANRARDFVKNVLIVDKGPTLGYAGEGFFSGGNIQALPPGDDVDEYVKDIISLGDGLYEQDLVEKVFRQSWDRIEDFKKMGVGFEENKDGSLKFVSQRGLKHNACFIAKPSGKGGRDMMAGLASDIEKRDIKYICRTYITELLKQDGTVVGAAGFDIRSGQFYIFKAKAVILAAGGCSYRGGYEDTHMGYGDGIDLAFNAGAELKNLEFVTMWVIPTKFRWEGVTYLLPMGAKFVNKHGEHFMEKYSPMLKSNCDYNFIARAMAFEARAGNYPFYLDCTAMKSEDKELMTPREGWTKLMYKQLLADGIRPFEERQEWTVTPWTNCYVHSDLEMKTAVPGLFVAGVLRNIDPGIYVGGWSIAKTAAFGRWAGESAGNYAAIRNTSMQLNAGCINEINKAAFAPLGRRGLEQEDVLHELQSTIFPVFILKTESTLNNALKKVKEIRQKIERDTAAADLHKLAKLNGLTSMARVAELSLHAALLRKESRASHYREDYPVRDDKNWLKWIIASQKEGEPDFRFEPVPLDKYKHKIWQYYSDKFIFPK